MNVITRSKMYHIRRLKTKPALEVNNEKYISDKFCGHEFTDDELDVLSYGDAVKVDCVSKTGKAFKCEVMVKERAGRYAWVPSFADDFGRTKEEWLIRIHRTVRVTGKEPYCSFHSEECNCQRRVSMEYDDYKSGGYWTADDYRDAMEAGPREFVTKECAYYKGQGCPHETEWAKLEKQHEDQVKREIDEYLAARVVI